MDRNHIYAIAHSMHESLAHRGPDDSDIWQDPDISLVLAHRRLSILDLSPEGRQPKASTSGRYIICYNGEIYNYLDIQKDLIALGHTFIGRSDTEVMLAAFDHWGINATLQKLNGMFAFALWDRQNRELHLVRDRFGKKPLYVGWAGQSLVFGSELKAFYQHPDFTPEIDRNSLALYMRYSYLCAPYSIFKNVWQLLPGSRITFNLDHLEFGQDLSQIIEPYWNCREIIEDKKRSPTHKTEDEIIEDFEKLLLRATQNRMLSDVSLGAFLSGGIDSSLVVSMMQSLSDQKVKTFSIGFHEDTFNEAEYAKKIARHLGTDHHEFYVSGQEALDVIPKLPDIYDEPFADQSQIPTYLICKHAREHVTVALTGDGGDEILGGYQRHYIIPATWAKISWIPHILRQAIGNTVQALPQALYSKLNPAHPDFGRRVHRLAALIQLNTPEDVYANLVGHWHTPSDIVLGGHDPAIPLTDPAWQPEGLNFSERMIYGDTLSYRPNDLMVKTDRAGMAVSLEARAPLMDYQLMEYCWTLPHNMKIRNMKGKYLLRQILKKYIPEKLFERPKQGFGIPVDSWLRDPMKDWAEDMLNASKLDQQGYLNTDIVRNSWDLHLKHPNTNIHGTRLWTVLMFQAWLDRWMP